MKVTADTITDDQISQLYRDLMGEPEWGISAVLQRDCIACQVALEYEAMKWIRDERAMKHRARCADLFNERKTQVAA